MPKDDYKMKVMKSVLKKENIYEVTTVFVSMPEFVAQRIRSYTIRNVKSKDK